MTVTVSAEEVLVDVSLLANKHLICDKLWERLVCRIVKEHDMERSLAERVMDQALAYLRLCGLESGRHYAPSAMVDIGWHIFLWYTQAYAEFCDRLCGFFIHHNPSDEIGVDYSTAGGAVHTVKAMRRLGITVDQALWLPAANGGNGQCYAHCTSEDEEGNYEHCTD